MILDIAECMYGIHQTTGLSASHQFSFSCNIRSGQWLYYRSNFIAELQLMSNSYLRAVISHLDSRFLTTPHCTQNYKFIHVIYEKLATFFSSFCSPSEKVQGKKGYSRIQFPQRNNIYGQMHFRICSSY